MKQSKQLEQFRITKNDDGTYSTAAYYKEKRIEFRVAQNKKILSSSIVKFLQEL